MRTLLIAAAVVVLMLSTAALLGPQQPPPPLPAYLVGDDRWLIQVRSFSQLRLILTIIDLSLTPIVLWIFVKGGHSAQLRRRLQQYGLRNKWLLAAAFIILLDLGLFLVRLPLLYLGYTLRSSFGLTAEPALDWLARQSLNLVVNGGIDILTFEVLFWLLRIFPRSWWLLASLAAMLGTIVLVYVYPVLITPLFFEQRPLTDSVLKARILQLGERIGVPVDDVYVIDASKQGSEGNAYFTGIGSNQRIVLYDTLLTNYPTDELLSIVAHEMGHRRAGHIWKGLLESWLITPFGLFIIYRLQRRVLPQWGIRAADDIANLPLMLLWISLAMIATLPLQNWQSRRWETEADHIALVATEDRQALAKTFVHLARQNLSDPTPPRLVEALFGTHPALSRRVAAALEGPLSP